ncbi:radical SAM/SPASM domain-containing protein, partial [Vibrio anguillarum]
IDASTAEIFKQIRSNNVLTADVEAKNADRIARLVADNILVPLQRSAGKVKRQLTKQINLWLQVTDSCNLACDYCYIPSLYSDKVLHKDTFFQLFQHFKDIEGLETVHLKLAGGEPLMVFSAWKDEVQWLRTQLECIGINLELRIITNLTRLTNEMICFFKHHSVIISVSVDGLGDTHDQHRKHKNGAGSFAVVMTNIERLHERGISPSVMITVAGDNYLGVPALVEYLIERDMTFRISDAKGGYLTPAQFEQTMDTVNALLDKAVDKGYPVSRRVIFSDLRTHEAASTPCSMGSHAAAIYLDGSVYFCHTEFQKGQPLGHLSGEQNLLSIIRSGRQKHFGLSDDCQQCQYRFVCAGGCPLYRVNGKSSMCNVYKKIISQVFNIYNKEDGKIT